MHTNSVAFYLQSCSGYGKRIFSKSGSLERILFVLIPILASKMQYQQTIIEPGPPTSSPGLFPQKNGWLHPFFEGTALGTRLPGPPIRLNRVNTTREDGKKGKGRGWIVYSVANYRPHLSHFWANVQFSRYQLSNFLFL